MDRTQSVGSSSATGLQFGRAELDSNYPELRMFDPGAPARVTIPAPGTYLIVGAIRFTGNGTEHHTRLEVTRVSD